MLPKNYSQNKNYNKSDKRETAGVILIIVFSFLLFCNLLGPLVLSGIGSAIKNISMGLLGYFSYPFYLYFLIWGVLLLQGKRMSVKRKYAVALILLFVCIIMIIQLATTSGYLYAFNNYIDYVYHGQTIGGLIFGVISYGLATLLTSVGAYVVLAFIMLGALLLVAGFFDRFLSGNVKKRKVKGKDISREVDKNKTFKSEAPSLYIDTISSGNGQNYVGGTSFDSLPDDRGFNNYGAYNNNDYSRNAALEAGVNAMRQEQDEAYEDLKRKADARKILFGDTEEYKKEAFGASAESNSYSNSSYNNGYSSNSGNSYSGYGNSFTPYPSSGSSSSRSSFSSVLSDIVPMPPEKSVDYNYFGNAIINGDSVKSKEPPKPETSSFNMNDIKNMISTETFGYNSEYNERFINGEKEKTEEQPPKMSLPPIINGDMITSGGAASGQNATVYQKEDAKPEFPEFTPGPIIRGSTGTVISITPEKTESEPKNEAVEDMVATADAGQTSFTEQSSQPMNIFKPEPQVTSDPSEFEYANSSIDFPVFEEHFADEEDAIEEEVIAEIPAKEEFVSDIPVISNTAPENVVSEDLDDIVDEYAEMVDESEFDDYDESEALIDDSIDLDDDGEEQLESYEASYGHPKFEGVTEKETQALNNRFEETSSFKIEEEVIDQSENAKYVTQTESQPKQAPIINAMPNIETQPKAQTVTVAEKTVAEPKAEQEKHKRKKPYKYVRPSLDLLTTQSSNSQIDSVVLEEKSKLLEETLTNLGIDATVESITVGPAVTRYELNMPIGMSVKKIEGKQADIQYGLACAGHIRVESPIPGKRAVGVEVPNEKVALVALRDIIDSKEFNSSSSPLTIALGKDIQGKVMTACIDKMPHLLIAGTTGSGKSACLNSLIISILYKASPDEVKLILVDPKCVEFSAYSGIPHMMIKDAITEPVQALNAFKWLREEMDRRYKVLQSNRVRNIGEYNKLQAVKDRELDKLPYIVVIVDEFADLMLSSGAGNRRKELEGMISSIAGKARAAGIHMILATQRPSADVITGTIKSNLPACIAFAVSNVTNSRIILDKAGAEALVGKGDMLFAPQDRPDGVRIQGSFVDNPEINSIADFVRENNTCEFDSEFEKAIIVKEENEETEGDESAGGASNSEYDKDLVDIVKAVMISGQASGAMIQRRFGIGYMRAAKIIDQMEELKFIGPSNGSKAREVLITKERYEEFFGVKFDD